MNCHCRKPQPCQLRVPAIHGVSDKQLSQSPGYSGDDEDASSQTDSSTRIKRWIFLTLGFLIFALAFAAYWFFIGPGAKFQIESINTVDHVVALDDLGFTSQTAAGKLPERTPTISPTQSRVQFPFRRELQAAAYPAGPRR